MRCGTAILLLAALTSAHQQPGMLAALPEPYHRQLLSFHASSKANGGDKKWMLDEDAEILMQASILSRMLSLLFKCCAPDGLPRIQRTTGQRHGISQNKSVGAA